MKTVRGLQARDLMCEVCGTHQSIYRDTAKLRPIGHKKHLWCVRCEKRTKHEEKGEKL
jgi:hypothetical protein